MIRQHILSASLHIARANPSKKSKLVTSVCARCAYCSSIVCRATAMHDDCLGYYVFSNFIKTCMGSTPVML